jgi:CubicO group peptidase (beta-lactamase class C family)
VTLTPSDFEELLEQQCRQHKLPGAAAAYIHDGVVQYSMFGSTDAQHHQAVTADTLFGIGSTSKTLTGTTMMALVERGLVSLDDKVVKHLPDLPVLDEQARDEVTVGQLLDHTAGWVGDAEVTPDWGNDALERAVPQLLAKAPQLSPPGALFSYNNIAVDVAGHLIATLHGTSFEEAVRDLVLLPLEMADTHYLLWDIANRPHAVGHVADEASVRAVPAWLTARHMAPSGGAFSTARDMMTYARFHLTGETSGRPPISDESRLLMQAQRSSCRSGFEGAGVSWLLGRRGELPLIEHGGNLSNLMTSTFSMAPQASLCVSVMGNSAAGTAVGNAIRDYLLERVVGPSSVAKQPMSPQPPLAEYVGIYHAGQWDVEVRETEAELDIGIRITNASIADDAQRESFEAKRSRVTFIAPDLVSPSGAPGPAIADFLRDPTGRIEFIRFGGRLARR